MQNRGFSLLEMIIYLAIIAGSLLAMISIALNIRSFYAKAEVQAELDYALNFSCQQLSALVRKSAGVDFAGSQLNSDNGVLAINDFAGSKIIDLDNGRLRLVVGANNYYLTPAKVMVSSFSLQSAANGVVASTTVAWKDNDSLEFRGQKTITCSLFPAAVCGANSGGLCQ